MKILLPADGSQYTQRAAEYLATHPEAYGRTTELHLLHVRPPIPYPGAAAMAGRDAIEKFEREESLEALATAEKPLRGANLPFLSTWEIGDPAESIAAYAKKHAIDLVVMGSHGRGALAGWALGSVVRKVIATTKVPVLVVR